MRFLYRQHFYDQSMKHAAFKILKRRQKIRGKTKTTCLRTPNFHTFHCFASLCRTDRQHQATIYGIGEHMQQTPAVL